MKNATLLTGGSNHIVFSVRTNDDQSFIVKFSHQRDTERKYQEGNRDTLFGGLLSIEREVFLLERIRRAGLPTPEVHGIYPSPWGDYCVMDVAPGENLPTYMDTHDHQLAEFLAIFDDLGEQLRKLHEVRYESFGNIMYGDVIEPEAISNFADRYLPINDRIIQVCHDKGGLTTEEAEQVHDFFTHRFNHFRDRLDVKTIPATLVITDLHGDNFFIENHKISSFFDVESSQAAPPEFEIYGLRFFVFNFYGEKEYKLAEARFWQAYTNGRTTFPDAEQNQLLDFFAACRLLEIFQSYWGIKDGIRDTWGERIKALLFTYMKTGSIDYLELGCIWRERDKQPVCSK